MDVSLEAKTKPLATLSAFSYVTPRRNEPKQMSYFNNEAKVSDVSMYDRLHNHVEGFDMWLPRDDRKHWKGRGLDINKETYPVTALLLQLSASSRRYTQAELDMKQEERGNERATSMGCVDTWKRGHRENTAPESGARRDLFVCDYLLHCK
ncbi:cilia- and flagella-associated protein 90 isoform X1 [Maylandia zebra]|uniref:cilia- and flagella-associated protein 90 isoform X1 n=1 Tax=Maylandia zebra TaxID=106582 RepID=UPI00403CD16C